MKLKIYLLPLSLLFLLAFNSCRKKGDKKELKTYTVTLENAAVKDAHCGLDLEAGKVYSVAEGRQRQEELDIAYGYMNVASGRYERCFLNMDYAGCFCGGSSYFSYGDQGNNDGSPIGYASYSVRNTTSIILATTDPDFDKIFSSGKKADLNAVLPDALDGQVRDQTFFSAVDNMISLPYVFFKTVNGKKGVLRVRAYAKDISTDYQLHLNPVTIDVVVER